MDGLSDWRAVLMAEGLSVLTVRGRLTGARAWVRWLGHRDPALAAPADVRAWLAWMRAQGYRPLTVRTYADAARRWDRWCGRDSFRGVVLPGGEALRELLSPEELRALLAVAELPAPWPVEAARAMLALGAGCGLRSFEMRGLRVPDVDLAGLRVLVWVGKGGGSSALPLPGAHVELHRAWLRRREQLAGPDQRAYLVRLDGGAWGNHAVDRVMWLLKERAGLDRPGLTIHALRHLAITSWDERAGTRTAQELARHRSISTTARYSHPTSGRLRAVADGAAASLLGACGPSPFAEGEDLAALVGRLAELHVLRRGVMPSSGDLAALAAELVAEERARRPSPAPGVAVPP